MACQMGPVHQEFNLFPNRLVWTKHAAVTHGRRRPCTGMTGASSWWADGSGMQKDADMTG